MSTIDTNINSVNIHIPNRTQYNILSLMNSSPYQKLMVSCIELIVQNYDESV